MTEVIGGDADLEALGRTLWRLDARQVHGGIVDQGIQLVPAGMKGVDEASHAVLQAQVDVHDDVPVGRNRHCLSCARRLLQVAGIGELLENARLHGTRSLQLDRIRL